MRSRGSAWVSQAHVPPPPPSLPPPLFAPPPTPLTPCGKVPWLANGEGRRKGLTSVFLVCKPSASNPTKLLKTVEQSAPPNDGTTGAEPPTYVNVSHRSPPVRGPVVWLGPCLAPHSREHCHMYCQKCVSVSQSMLQTTLAVDEFYLGAAGTLLRSPKPRPQTTRRPCGAQR